MAPLSYHPATPFLHRLSTRIVGLSAVTLILALSMIIGTLRLSRQLEGAGAAINDAGSLRMRASLIGIRLGQEDGPAVHDQSALLDQTLAHLDRGDPARPLFLPASPEIRAQFDSVRQSWHDALQPAIQRGDHGRLYLDNLPDFIAQADALVSMIELENAYKTAWLRRSQIALAALACAGSLAILMLLTRWFVTPVRRLEHGLLRIERREFVTRLPVITRDEFGHLAQGFNRMAGELQSLYQDLAQRVTHKTAQLATRNGELVALYDMTAFLHEAHDVDALSRGFLSRVMTLFKADGGSVRILAPDGGQLHAVVSEGLSERLLDAQRCRSATGCACGAVAIKKGFVVLHDLRRAPDARAPTHCGDEGFQSVAAFSIQSQDATLGSFSLHFRAPRALLPTETRLLETLGKHVGTALQNHRLESAARQLAVAHERHLVAQGLHDSIAQSLNFLKMQLHLLEGATARNAMAEVRELVPLLRGGLEESYEDVRELLVNFRTKFGTGDLRDAVTETVRRFEHQTDTKVDLSYDETGGPPLPPEQQLQVLFILQEALSNIRKHASASRVTIRVHNARDFHLFVQDNGDGYDATEIAGRGEAHVGFHIMRERALRLGARLILDGLPGAGASVDLLLAATARQAA